MKSFDNIFRLHRLLRHARYPVKLGRIRETLECSTPTARRTIRELRDKLKAPIEYSDDPPGYRYANDVFELPGIWLTAPELSALLLLQQLLQSFQPGLLEDALAPLRRKIDEILESQGIATAGENRIRLLKLAARSPGPCFGEVASAVLQRRRLWIVYSARSTGRTTEREVSPQRLTHYRENWYVDAWCHRQEGLRTFAVDRIGKARLLDTAAIDIDEAVLDEELSESYGIFSGKPTATARLLISPERAPWTDGEQWHPAQKSERLESGELLLEFPYSRSEELVLDILRLGPDVKVIDPPELREAVIERLRAALEQYSPPPK